MSFLSGIESWFTHAAWPTLKSFLGGVVHDEVAAVAPIAQQAVARLATEEVTALTSGNNANTGHILANVVKDTTAAMESAGIKAGANSVLTAVGAAIPKPTGG